MAQPNIYNKVSILVVDDNKDFLEIFSMKLTQAGFQVTTAHGGAEGIEQVKRAKPDLMMLDVEMPGMNGLETIAKLKGDPATAGVKVVFLTNYGEAQQESSWIDEKLAREAGAIDYIKKSDDLNSIVEEVKKVLKHPME